LKKAYEFREAGGRIRIALPPTDPSSAPQEPPADVTPHDLDEAERRIAVLTAEIAKIKALPVHLPDSGDGPPALG
jgi:hypothetical protein